MVGESSILKPPVGRSHFVAPLLPAVLNWLLPLCELSCSYAGQTVAASARAAVNMIETQIATLTDKLIGVFILPLFHSRTRAVYGDVPVAISGTSSGLLVSLFTLMNRSELNGPKAFAVNSTV